MSSRRNSSASSTTSNNSSSHRQQQRGGSSSIRGGSSANMSAGSSEDRKMPAATTVVRSRTATTPTKSYATYEATKAAELAKLQADPIHWKSNFAFRNSNYRLLYHQNGYIGHFNIRLLEASCLKRSHWNLLALGPVKHLGLSRMHGPVSSFCTLSLQFQQQTRTAHNNNKTAMEEDEDDVSPYNDDDMDRKPAARGGGRKGKGGSTRNHKNMVVSSPVIYEDDNPVWDNCVYEFPLKKGDLSNDGMRIVLHVRSEEEGTVYENVLPGTADRVLGVGSLDLTELCLGETTSGQSLSGVRDAWIDLHLPQQQQRKNRDDDDSDDYSDRKQPPYNRDDHDDPLAAAGGAAAPSITGKVRVLVSYQPYGMEPQPKDVVALEAFARMGGSKSACRPVLDPLSPLVVLDRRGSYLLCEYQNVLAADHDTATCCVKLHRNAVFVIERQNVVDAAHNLALLPLDVVLSTPVGKTCANVLAPVGQATKELLMPATLSLKLAWLAARTTGLGVASGVQALGSTIWHEGSSGLMTNNNSHHHNNNRKLPPPRKPQQQQRAQFVQL